MNHLSHRPPAVGVCRNPLIGMKPDDMKVARVGVTIKSLMPENPGLLICVLNGVPLPRLTARQRAHHAALVKRGELEKARVYLGKAARKALNWEHVRTRPGDVVEWHDQPQDKEDLRVVIQIAAVVVSIYFPAFAPYAAAIVVAYNLLVPPTAPRPPQPEQAADSIFNTSLNGNQARLDQPIWRNFGRVKISPPFASAPYYEYIDDDGDDLDNAQRYHAVFAVGYDDHEVESVFIGRTPITHFQDVLIADYLAPGVLPTMALCNVVTSTEVSQLELESGHYVGGYAACQPRRKAAAIGIDVLCPQGLGKSGPLTVTYRVECREINDYGFATSAWRMLGSVSKTADTNTPQRWSVKYTLAPAARVEVRMVRTDIKDTDSTARHALQWIGLRAYLDEDAPLNSHTAHYEVVMRASEQLSAASQRDFSMIVWPLIRTWNPDTGWSAKQRCRTPAWAIADLWTDAIWGEGLPDSRIDLQGLYDFSVTNDARQDRFDFTFVNATNAWDAAQLIARAGRARCFRRYGVNTLSRDEWHDLPMTALTPRNTIPDTMLLNEQLPVRESPDGIVVQYRSNVTWDTIEIECPCPGYSVSDPEDPRFHASLPTMSNPVYKQIDGVTGAIHAEREGLYEAANLLLRKRTISCTTEMQGVITSYMMPVLWQPDIAGYGQSGDVAFWNFSTLVMGLTEKPNFGLTGSTYLTLIRDDGTLTDPVLVTPGPTDWDITLPAAPDFEIIVDDGTRERPKFILGDMDLLIKISGISDGGKSQSEDGMEGAQLYNIAGVVDDVRVHTADQHLLPGPGDIQDPVDAGGEFDGGGGFFPLAYLTIHDVKAGSYAVDDDRGAYAQINFNNDGTLTWEKGVHPFTAPATTVVTTGTYDGEWLTIPTEPAAAALYEIRVTLWPEAVYLGLFGYRYNSVSALSAGSSAVNTWLSCGTSHTWKIDEGLTSIYPYGVIALLRVEIREAASTLVQESELIGLAAYTATDPGFVI